MNIKWCRKCQYLGTRWDAYNRWFAMCEYEHPPWDSRANYERRIVSFYYDKRWTGEPLDHLLEYDDKSNYTEKELYIKPDLNIVPEPQFKIPEGCPWRLEYIMENQFNDNKENKDAKNPS